MKTIKERARSFAFFILEATRFDEMEHEEKIQLLESEMYIYLKEQDKITRHACAEKVITMDTSADWNIDTFASKAHNEIMNTKAV